LFNFKNFKKPFIVKFKKKVGCSYLIIIDA
jgi:hypothetical protein